MKFHQKNSLEILYMSNNSGLNHELWDLRVEIKFGI